MDRKKLWFLLSLAVVYFLLITVTAYHKPNGLKDMWKLTEAIDALDREIAGLKIENERRLRELASLNRDDTYVEAIARENLGLVKPGEVVYEFVEAGDLAKKEPVARPAGGG